jgi:transglutaminase-like putative cysteine protease
MSRFLPVLLFVVGYCSVSAATAAAQITRGSKVTAQLKFSLTAEEPAGQAVIDVLLPKTEPGRQKVNALKYSLRPVENYERDGNAYAQFLVTEFPAEFTIDLEVEAYRYDLTTARNSAQRAMESKEAITQWLIHEQYLEKQSLNIQQVAAKISGRDDEATARACFDYVVKTLKKSAFAETGSGASQALRNGQGDCTEFADLFVTLCRAKGIPARTCQGYLLEPVSDTQAHDWAEVYLETLGWVPVDPVFAHLKKKTTFSELRPIYLQVERHRRNGALNLHHFWNYRYEGSGQVKVKSAFSLISRTDLK